MYAYLLYMCGEDFDKNDFEALLEALFECPYMIYNFYIELRLY